MCSVHLEETGNPAMTPEEEKAFMAAPAQRSEVLGALRAVMNQEVRPMVDSQLGFIVSLMRYMLDAAGVMSGDDFNRVYAEYAEEFVRRYDSEDPPGAEEAENS